MRDSGSGALLTKSREIRRYSSSGLGPARPLLVRRPIAARSEETPVILFAHRASFAAPLAALAVLGLASAAQGQSMNANSAAYNAGYARFAAQENAAVDVGVRDANGDLVIVDGLIQTGEVGASAQAGGAIDTFAGVGASSGSSAVGNSLNVVTQGSDNTVIVSSQQTNTGNVSASTH